MSHQPNLFGWTDEVPVSDTSKTCSKCGKTKPKSKFPFVNGRLLRPECKACQKHHQRLVKRLRKENPPPADGYKCPICTRGVEELQDGNKNGPWCLDHNHKTEAFRGYLCHRCNRGIGSLKDDVAVFERAIAYLSA